MKEIKLEAVVENIPRATAFVSEELDKIGCPMKARAQIDIAIDELFGNIAHYAYPCGTGDAVVQFEFDAPSRTAAVTFMDSGVPYDPLKKEDPDVTLPAEQRKIGGLGIFLVKKTMDEMRYERRDGRNVLTIKKRI